MPTTTWSILSKAGKQHTIRLEHGHFSGKREIYVDQVLLEKQKKLFDSGSRHQFIIDDTNFEIAILTNGVTFSYFLIMEGHPVPSEQQRMTGKTAEDITRNRYLRDLPFWQELGRILGLRYRSITSAMWPYRHQLSGVYRDSFIIVSTGIHSKTNKQGYTVMVRHAPFTANEQLERIHSDPRVQSAHGALQKSPSDLFFARAASAIFLPKAGKETPVELAARIQGFVSVVGFHTTPLDPDVCENEPVRHCSGRDPQWVMVNQNPYFLCAECQAEIPNWGKEAEKEYKAMPGHLSAGLLVGFGVALLGAVLWAALGLLLDITAAIVSYAVFIGIFIAMRKVGTKVTVPSVLAAIVLTFFSITLGQYFLIFLMFLREGFPVSIRVLGFAFEASIQSPAMLFSAYFFALLGAAPALWSVIAQHRSSLKEAFQPKVEHLPGNR